MSEILDRLRSDSALKVMEIREPREGRIYFEVELKDFIFVVERLFKEFDARFISATALQTEFGFEIVYHFSLDKEKGVISVRIRLGKENPTAVSITSLRKGGEFIEREIYEMFGINFIGHSELKGLFLDEFYGQEHPMRRQR